MSAEADPVAQGGNDPAGAVTGEQDWPAQVRRSRFGSLIVLLVTVLAVGIGAWLVMRPGTGEISQVDVQDALAAPRVGDRAPDFTATTLEGGEVSLEAMRGRPVWLVFMATWCSGCRAETPDVQAAHEQAGDDGVQVVAIYVGESSTVVGQYAERLGLTFTQVPDPQTQLSAAYGVMGVPAHYFIDSSGIVQQTRVGALSFQQISEAIGAITD